MEFEDNPNNPCYEYEFQNEEEMQYCVVSQSEFKESEMLFIPSQKEWVCIDSVEEYLQMHYTHAETYIYDTIRNEVEKLILITKR